MTSEILQRKMSYLSLRKTLNQTMAELGHSFVDVLKMDVDGAEWRAFESAFAAFPRGLPIGQLQLEATGDDMRAVPANIFKIADPRPEAFFQRMFDDGFALFHLETNPFTCWVPRHISPSVEYAFLNTSHFGLPRPGAWTH